MKRLFVWLSIIFAGIVILEIALGTLNRKLLSVSDVRVDGIEHLLTDADEDIVIIGNSAGACHFDAARMEDCLRLTCYNGSTVGSSVKFNAIALQGLLNRHHPKLIVLAINPENLAQSGLGQTSITFPIYYGRGGAAFDSALRRIHPYRSKLFMLNIARTDRNLFRRLAYKSGLIKFPHVKGFQPYPASKNHPAGGICNDSIIRPRNETLSDLAWIIDSCDKNGVPLIICFTPHAYQKNNYGKAISVVKRLCGDRRVTIWDDTSMYAAPGDTALFHDEFHLNRTGAEMYTDTVIKRLRSAIPLLPPKPA